MNDSTSYVAQIVNRESVNVRRPKKRLSRSSSIKERIRRRLILAARRPDNGLFMWSEQLEDSTHVVSGNPNYNNSSAAALLYDVAHAIPWDWKVSLYTWTKGSPQEFISSPPCSCYLELSGKGTFCGSG